MSISRSFFIFYFLYFLPGMPKLSFLVMHLHFLHINHYLGVVPNAILAKVSRHPHFLTFFVQLDIIEIIDKQT
jgi:hypothetical protein